MFCSKCGKEIADEAVICPACGCATANYHTPAAAPTQNATYSQDYLKITEFEDNVRSLHVTSIFSLVLCLGIGIIFSFVVWAKAKSLTIPVVTTNNANELAMLESAKRKLKNGLTFSFIPVIVLLILWCILCIGGMMSVEGFLLPGILMFGGILLVWCLGIKWTKHLNEELK